jgi:hypothetical protein
LAAGAMLREEVLMQVRRILMTFVWALSYAPVAAWAADPDPPWILEKKLARELISVMKLDEQAAQKVEGRILAQCQVEKCDADLRECLMKIDTGFFVMVLG